MKYYTCQGCGQDFEAVNAINCPFCGSLELEVEAIGGVEAVDFYYHTESEEQFD